MWVHWLTDDMSKFYKLAQWRVLNNHLCAWAEVRFDSVLLIPPLILRTVILWLIMTLSFTLWHLNYTLHVQSNSISHYSHVNKYRLSIWSAVRYEKFFYYTHTKPLPAGTLTHTHDNDSWARKRQTHSKSCARTLKDSLHTWEKEVAFSDVAH